MGTRATATELQVLNQSRLLLVAEAWPIVLVILDPAQLLLFAVGAATIVLLVLFSSSLPSASVAVSTQVSGHDCFFASNLLTFGSRKG